MGQIGPILITRYLEKKKKQKKNFFAKWEQRNCNMFLLVLRKLTHFLTETYEYQLKPLFDYYQLKCDKILAQRNT